MPARLHTRKSHRTPHRVRPSGDDSPMGWAPDAQIFRCWAEIGWVGYRSACGRANARTWTAPTNVAPTIRIHARPTTAAGAEETPPCRARTTAAIANASAAL